MGICIKRLLMVIPALVLLAASLTYGANKEGILSMAGWWERQSVVKALGLTYEQITRIQEICNKDNKKTRELKAELKRQNVELSKLVDDDILDDAKISEKADKVVLILAAVEKADIMRRVAAIRELSVEQKKKLKELAR